MNDQNVMRYAEVIDVDDVISVSIVTRTLVASMSTLVRNDKYDAYIFCISYRTYSKSLLRVSFLFLYDSGSFM